MKLNCPNIFLLNLRNNLSIWPVQDLPLYDTLLEISSQGCHHTDLLLYFCGPSTINIGYSIVTVTWVSL